MRTSILSPITPIVTQDINARFRVSGKEAELWHADTGEIESAEFSMEDGRTIVAVASRRARVCVRGIPKPVRLLHSARTCKARIRQIGGPWEVSFQPGRAPPKARLNKT